MIKALLGAAAIALAMVAAPAVAADVPYGGPAYSSVAPSYCYWCGGYAGLNVGYQWGSVTNFPLNPSGFAGGVQAGYNWQTGQFVLGAEADLQVSAADDVFAPYKFSNPWFGTVRGRGGIGMNNVLIYLTGGLAYGGGRVDLAGLSETHTHVGWTVGGGIEVGFTPRWSAKAEYLFIDLNDRVYSLTGVQNGLESSLLRFGVNYRF